MRVEELLPLEGFPKYWASWEGKIITVLVLSEGSGVSWENLVKQTGLTGFQLRSALATLVDAHVITKEETEANYHLADEKLSKEYQRHIFFSKKDDTKTDSKDHEENEPVEEKIKPQLIRPMSTNNPLNHGKDRILWISQWRDAKDLSFSLENKHFFLAGPDLDDFTKQVVLDSKEAILVANPCLENCYLTIALEHIARKGRKVKIITRPPDCEETNYDKKQDCHALLRSTGVSINYQTEIHSKVLTIDGYVAIVSSTNFYSGYSEGPSLEAGIVSVDERVVNSIVEYILGVFKKSEPEKNHGNITGQFF
jgi:hypothetical protein